MVELSELALLALCRVIQWEFDSSINSLEASSTECCECCTAMFCSHSNTIYCSLSDSCVLGIGVAADLLDDLWIHWAQEVWSQEFNHIVENEEQEFGLSFAFVLCHFWENFGDEFLDKRLACVSVCLEHDTKKLRDRKAHV